eukprot:TRINITY_DN352_c0_g1_i2.p1 TRINITY_DN352_c0_g1~~TRINITY_DN352_c0_g1_i2.p1  ORF type:complete len:381 (+),score=56.79 TRINITY_DN352_c0_g1_i2:871-2013(+)
MESNVNVKALAHPSKLESVSRDACSSWAFGTRPYIQMLGLFTIQQLRKVEASANPIQQSDLQSSFRQKSEDLWCVLVNLLGESPRKYIRRVPEGNGIEAWRVLLRRCCPEGGSAQSGHLSQLLNWSFGDGSLAQFGQHLVDFEVARDRYDRHHELEEIGGDVCKTVVIGGAPEPLKTQLRLLTGSHSYSALLEKVEEFLAASDAWPDAAAHSHYEVASRNDEPSDQVSMMTFAKGKGKGKGKGKSKGKSKGAKDKRGLQGEPEDSTGVWFGESPTISPWDMQCYRCWGWGHRVANCPSPSTPPPADWAFELSEGEPQQSQPAGGEPWQEQSSTEPDREAELEQYCDELDKLLEKETRAEIRDEVWSEVQKRMGLRRAEEQ